MKNLTKKELLTFLNNNIYEFIGLGLFMILYYSIAYAFDGFEAVLIMSILLIPIQRELHRLR